MSTTVVLTARPYVQMGRDIKLNCSADFAPVGHIAEFLANKVTFTNIRKHSLACFNSKLNEMCLNTSCSCAKNSKSYIVFFEPDLKHEQISFSCKMRLTGNDIKTSNEVIVNIIGKITFFFCICSIKFSIGNVVFVYLDWYTMNVSYIVGIYIFAYSCILTNDWDELFWKCKLSVKCLVAQMLAMQNNHIYE